MLTDAPEGFAPSGLAVGSFELTSSLGRIVAAAVDMMRAEHGALVLFDDGDRIVDLVLLDRASIDFAAAPGQPEPHADHDASHAAAFIGGDASVLGDLRAIVHSPDATRLHGLDGIAGAPAPLDE